MRGSPLLTVLAMVALFLLVGWPVWRLTRPPERAATEASPAVAPEPAPATGSTLRHLIVTADFTAAPDSFEILYADRRLLSGHGPAQTFQATADLPLPGDGADFVFRAHWKSGPEPAAARVRISGTGFEPAEKIFWNDRGGAEGVVPLNLK